MLGNCTEKMVLISSTTNEWPQNECQGINMGSTGTTIMEKPPQQQIPQEALKCPRCDSSNTKFCYYNNYSLSQPRHFCKACKRYWTRGGTLRNVPVGGGCRRNKKIKRSISDVDQPLSSSSSPTAASSNPTTNPVFFGFPTNPNPNSSIGTLSYPNFNPRISSADTVSGFDLQPQMSGYELSFGNNIGNYHNGSSNPLLSSYSHFGSLSNSPNLASLLGSNLKQQKINNNGGLQGLGSFEEMQMGTNMSSKVKREDGQSYQIPNFQNHLEQINHSDPTVYWNATNLGAFLDPTNLGSSVPSLI